ncbi:MAG: polyprenyl synthetase family protein [Clostridia bacterium]|nr:polyprenyl synthetase family protein [Clostridia bacterium]
MNKFSQRLNEDIELIDKALCRYLGGEGDSTCGSYYHRELFAFSGRADSLCKPLMSSMEYSLMSGGKRIRPVLTLEFCRMLNGDTDAALRMGAALEMVHTYSLIHDDLPCMDDDDIRRGKPTNHKVYGESTAVLAGDGLLTHAFSVLAQNMDESPLRYLNAVQILAESAGIRGMVGGQQMDLAGESKRLTREEHEEMTLRKTGELIRAACLLGCAASDASKEAQAAAEKYAYGIGLAFQIIDDILDMGTEDEKTTFLSFYSVDGAREYARRLTDSAIDAIRDYPQNEFLVQLAEALHQRKI